MGKKQSCRSSSRAQPRSRSSSLLSRLSSGTVVSVFERLQADGYVSCRVGSGTRVNRVAAVNPARAAHLTLPVYIRRIISAYATKETATRFNNPYAKAGRPSIAPEKLLRALLLQALYSVRSEWLPMEQFDYNLLFRWFVGSNMDDCQLECDRVHQKPRARARWHHCRSLVPSRAPAGTRGEFALERVLHRGWNAAGSVGEFEKFSAKGC